MITRLLPARRFTRITGLTSPQLLGGASRVGWLTHLDCLYHLTILSSRIYDTIYFAATSKVLRDRVSILYTLFNSTNTHDTLYD